MDVKCQCGTVSFRTSTPQPIDLYHCHCLECRKQSASAFGTSAIFSAEGIFPLSADLSSKLAVWSRPGGEESQGKTTMNCYFCKVCGVRIMHRDVDAKGEWVKGTVSVKGGCVEGLDWRAGKHIFCRSAVVPIPEGAERWEAGPE